jgi:hypothetical protein
VQPSRPSTQPAHKVGNDVIFVLGAGVDKALGLPLVNDLFRELSDFVRGSGQPINKAIRKHVKNLRFDLQTYDGDQAENLPQKLLGSHPQLLPLILQALARHPDQANANVRAIRTVMEKLTTIANVNELDEAMVTQLSHLAGEADSGVGDTLLDTDHIAFRPKIRQAIKTLLTTVSTEIPGLNRDEQEAFAEVIAILSNFEDLMGSLFAGYFTKHLTNQKKYFYLTWVLWAYIRHREAAGRPKRDESFYKTLSDVGSGGGVITFNYTDFFFEGTQPKNGYFHGDCKTYIQFDTRDYVTGNVQAREATTLERMVDFIDSFHVDWSKEPSVVPLPAFVPPLAVKPIICTEYLDRWYECGKTIKGAKTIVILGYSFNVADEHFNDLIRKYNKEAKLIVFDPNLKGVVDRVCQTIRFDPTALRVARVAGFDCKKGGRLTFVKAKAEEITATHFMELLAWAETVVSLGSRLVRRD